MTEDTYFLIGWVIYGLVLIATPILYGYEKAKGNYPNNALYFWGAMLSLIVVPMWAFFIAGLLVLLLVLPFVWMLNQLGKKLAARKAGSP